MELSLECSDRYRSKPIRFTWVKMLSDGSMLRSMRIRQERNTPMRPSLTDRLTMLGLLLSASLFIFTGCQEGEEEMEQPGETMEEAAEDTAETTEEATEEAAEELE